MPQITKKGARDVTREMERLAGVLEQNYAVLGIPQHIAADAARRLDLLSDAIERQAGMDPQDREMKQVLDKEASFNAGTIGEVKPGPLEQIDSDEPYMSGEFTQQENKELRSKQESGELSDGKADMKVAFTNLVKSLEGSNLTGKQAAMAEKALRLATKVIITAKKAEEDESSEEPEEDESSEEPEEAVEEVTEEKQGGKKASYGFNLYR